MKIVLFDIDGTLVSVRGAGRQALQLALQDITGVAGTLEGVRLAGSTDPVIVEHALAQHLGRALSGPEELARILDAYLAHLPRELEALAGTLHVYPGAHALLSALVATGRHMVGLATGNVEAGAFIKLRAAGLDAHFGFGGYGSDAACRTTLVRRAIERGQDAAYAAVGRRPEPAEAVVIGDTERDVEAARAAGAVAVGVLAGCADPDALARSRPDLTVSSLDDPELWRFLEVEGR